MSLYESYYLGCCVESLKITEMVLPLVKTRKRCDELPLLETLRQIGYSLEYYEIEGPIREKVKYWTERLSKEYKADRELRKADADELYQDAKNIDEMLLKELLDRPILELSHKGALNPKALLKTSKGQASAIFDNKIWARLPEIAKSDFSDCAKCLLTEAPTPAVMVGLRGIEAVIGIYYENKIGKASRKMLGEMIEELKKLPESNEKLLGYMDYLRSEKRNLAQHPNKTFKQKEAERILMEIVNAVHDIYADIDLKKQVSNQGNGILEQ